MTRVVMMGTPESALPTLEVLRREFEVALVVTRPDRARGRSRKPVPPPVKVAADSAGLAVAQPGSSEDLAAALEQAGPFDMGVVVAYGRILRPEVLALPRGGLLNLHFSLLPRWRGAAPVARALMAGDTMTGVTIIKLDEGLDTGPVLTAQAVDILPDENAGSLTARLAELGAALLLRVIGPYLAGDLEPVPQVDEGAIYAERIEAEDRIIDTADGAAAMVNKVRAMAPTPGATLEVDGQRHKVLAARPSEHTPPAGTWEVHDGVPVVATGSGGVELIRLQPPGRRPQSGADWLRGLRRDRGTVA